MQQIQLSGRMSQPQRVALWRQYREHGDIQARDRLVLSLTPLVKSIVYRKAREIPARGRAPLHARADPAGDWRDPRPVRESGGQIHAQLKRGLRDELAVDSRLLLEVS